MLGLWSQDEPQQEGDGTCEQEEGAKGDAQWSSKIVGPDGSTRSAASVTSCADPVATVTPTYMISY